MPRLTIEEILPISTPLDPIERPSISAVEKNHNVPKAEVVFPEEATTREKPLTFITTRRASREDMVSPIATTAEPVTKVVKLSNFNDFALVHALINCQLVTEEHIKIVEVPEVENQDAGRHASILPQLIQILKTILILKGWIS